MKEYDLNKMEEQVLKLSIEFDDEIKYKENSIKNLTQYAYNTGYAQKCIKELEIAKEQLKLIKKACDLLHEANNMSS